MPKYRVAVVYVFAFANHIVFPAEATRSFPPPPPFPLSGGGIAGLCLAASLIQLNSTADSDSEVHVDIYEASPEFVEVGAGVTLWGRVCEALRHMGMDEDCIRASVVVASTSGEGRREYCSLFYFILFAVCAPQTDVLRFCRPA